MLWELAMAKFARCKCGMFYFWFLFFWEYFFMLWYVELINIRYKMTYICPTSDFQLVFFHYLKHNMHPVQINHNLHT